jgi:hypothetical protein
VYADVHNPWRSRTGFPEPASRKDNFKGVRDSGRLSTTCRSGNRKKGCSSEGSS